MKQQIISSFRSIIADRPLLLIVVGFIVSSLIVLTYLLITLRPSELQVVIHYTSFGTTNFYRDKWYYLLSFAAFILIMVVAHIALTYRILMLKGRDAALGFAWLGVVMVFISAAVIYQVLEIASLT
jgi:hypothetical protein